MEEFSPGRSLVGAGNVFGKVILQQNRVEIVFVTVKEYFTIADVRTVDFFSFLECIVKEFAPAFMVGIFPYLFHQPGTTVDVRHSIGVQICAVCEIQVEGTMKQRNDAYKASKGQGSVSAPAAGGFNF